MKRRTFKVEGEAPVRLLRAVQEGLGVEAAEARAFIERGAVYVKGRRAQDGGIAVKPGEPVTVVVEEGGRDARSLRSEQATALGLRVLFEDRDVIAVDKPAGVVAQPTPGGTERSLLELVSERLGGEAGLVHRLDRQTSGVTIFGKHRDATSGLARAFREGTAKKRYLAVIPGGVLKESEGVVDLPLARDPTRVGRWRAVAGGTGLSAITQWELLHDGGEGAFALVALFPQTGRTHQLRAHLRALGAPILGDALYEGLPEASDGKALVLKAPRCLLHAQRLSLPHPRSGEVLTIEAPLPEDLKPFFAGRA